MRRILHILCIMSVVLCFAADCASPPVIVDHHRAQRMARTASKQNSIGTLYVYSASWCKHCQTFWRDYGATVDHNRVQQLGGRAQMRGSTPFGRALDRHCHVVVVSGESEKQLPRFVWGRRLKRGYFMPAEIARFVGMAWPPGRRRLDEEQAWQKDADPPADASKSGPNDASPAENPRLSTPADNLGHSGTNELQGRVAALEGAVAQLGHQVAGLADSHAAAVGPLAEAVKELSERLEASKHDVSAVVDLEGKFGELRTRVESLTRHNGNDAGNVTPPDAPGSHHGSTPAATQPASGFWRTIGKTALYLIAGEGAAVAWPLTAAGAALSVGTWLWRRRKRKGSSGTAPSGTNSGTVYPKPDDAGDPTDGGSVYHKPTGDVEQLRSKLQIVESEAKRLRELNITLENEASKVRQYVDLPVDLGVERFRRAMDIVASSHSRNEPGFKRWHALVEKHFELLQSGDGITPAV